MASIELPEVRGAVHEEGVAGAGHKSSIAGTGHKEGSTSMQAARSRLMHSVQHHLSCLTAVHSSFRQRYKLQRHCLSNLLWAHLPEEQIARAVYQEGPAGIQAADLGLLHQLENQIGGHL